MSHPRPHFFAAIALSVALLATGTPLAAQDVVLPDPPKAMPAAPPAPPPQSTTITIERSEPYPGYHRLVGYPDIPTASTPKDPPAKGQRLIDWQRPPLLDYVIPEKWRGMQIACGEDRIDMLTMSAATCAPVLSMAKQWLEIDYATMEANINLSKDPATAEKARDDVYRRVSQLVKNHPAPRWPLEHYMLAKAHAARANTAAEWKQFDIAGPSYDAAIAVLKDAPFEQSQAIRSRTFQQKGRMLLEQHDFAAAARNYDAAFNADSDDMFVPFSGLRDHSQAMITAAIVAGKTQQARDWLDRYFRHYTANAEKHGRSADFTAAVLQQELLSLRLYLEAARGDERAVRATLANYERTMDISTTRAYERRCRDKPLFPYVVAPLHKKADIAAKLAAMGCSLEGLDAVPTRGVTDAKGKVLLPPHR